MKVPNLGTLPDMGKTLGANLPLWRDSLWDADFVKSLTGLIMDTDADVASINERLVVGRGSTGGWLQHFRL
jgi:hypothetical protein